MQAWLVRLFFSHFKADQHTKKILLFIVLSHFPMPFISRSVYKISFKGGKFHFNALIGVLGLSYCFILF